MNTYKITNITNSFGKRDLNYNMPVTIVYVDNMIKKSIILKAGDTVYLSIMSLPLSIHRLRAQGLIIVVESFDDPKVIMENENKANKKPESKITKNKKKVEKKTTTAPSKKTTSTKKKTTDKETSSTVFVKKEE